ncbi:MAG: aryl-sulfate sulfotransferase [Myxococcota bacterium]
MWLWAACQDPTEPGPPPDDDTGTPSHSSPTPHETGCAPVDVVSLDAAPRSEPIGVTLDWTTSAPGPVELTCALTAAPPLWRQWVSFGGDWRYLEADAPAGWADPGFDDAGWALGTAPFAFGDPAQTPLSAGGRTVYLRAAFDAPDPATVLELAGAVRRDDGVAVWLDGIEVFRDNLPAGPLSPDTAALADVSGGAEVQLRPFTPPVTTLGAGPHVLAVELHPFGSADLAFDLRLAARVAEPIVPEEHVVATDAGSATVLGLLADASYTCTATAACGGEARQVAVDTPPLPVPEPLLATRPGSAVSSGAYTLYNHQRPCLDAFTNRLYVVDPDGRVRWHRELGIDLPSSIDIESAWIEGQGVLWGGSDQPEGRPQIVALDHTEVHRAAYPGVTSDVYHHDVEWVDGEIVGLVNRPVTGPVDTEGFGLVAYDAATQTVTWSWDAQTAVDAGQLPPPTQPDPYHANSLASVVDADGPGVYVSLLDTDTVIRIDRATGDVTWTLGRGGDFALVDPSGAPLPDDAWFDGLHAVDVFDGRLYLYDNGQDVRQSQVMVFELDSAARVATLAWSWTEVGWYEPIWGDADELPNGNVLIAMAHNYCVGGNPAHPGALVEVERPSGEVVWRLDFLDGDDATYRSQRIDGCAMFANRRFCP